MNIMQVNDMIHGFKVNRIRPLDEIQGEMYEMVHEKTNARAIWLKRNDENKTFSIAFKTTPVDDTGVFHILEHSVLNGSRKYPVREPFVDLLKGSLQTFLNAMTYPDKTVYPVSSRNDKDFINLMRVYMDAVFHPLVRQNPNVFYQEGWHYELNDVDADPIYKGVVFNEMKGAFSSPDGVKGRLMMHALFPDNCYGNESGGDPDYITDLSYEQFCASHARYYNPSNSYIFLDGDMDIENVLKIIDEEYLSEFGKEGDLIDIAKQTPVVNEVTKDYEIAPDDDPAGKSQMAYGYVFGDYCDYEKTAAFSLIASVLCGSNESPLKKAILSKGLGEDVSFDVQDGILQPYLEIDVYNTDMEKKEEVEEAIKEVLSDAVKNGIDRKELEASLNQKEFKALERDFGGMPKGLVFALTALDAWLYGGDPKDSICFGDLFKNLREKLSTSYYEDLIREYILESKHCAKIFLKPSNTLGEEKLRKEKEKLQAIKASWTKEEKEELVEMNRRLAIWQNEEDTPEQKATLPALHLEDLKKTPSSYPIEVNKNGDNTILLHPNETGGISYTSLMAKANDLNEEEITITAQLMTLLGNLPTKNYDALTLNREIKALLGDFSATLSGYKNYKQGNVNDYIIISWSALNRNDTKANELVKEILYRTDFSDKKAIRDILKQNLFGQEQAYINAGHSLALQRASSYSSSVSAIAEYAKGYEAYRYLKDLDANWEEKSDHFLKKLQELAEKLFIRERYLVSVAGADAMENAKGLLDDAPNGTIGEDKFIAPLGSRKEGIAVPANISYAAKSSMLNDRVEKIGTMIVLSNILSYDYLWNNVRVKGGAYGCGFRSGFNKTAGFYSYRDPSPANTLRIFEETPQYLKDFVAKKTDIENYIVGTTGDFDPYLSLRASILTSDLEYLMSYSYEDKCEILTQILSTTREDIERTIRNFEFVNEDDNVCVIGNKAALQKCEGKLDTIFDLSAK
ncbi:MAG: insulinase family protein [Erysipelotrichaceae bacterium]|nr:insulinase family protein [Erysipelotrichaceae bacterium]